MKILYFLKIPLVIFLIGLLVSSAGFLLKIRHWQGADEAITAGSLVAGAGIAYGIIKILFMKKPV